MYEIDDVDFLDLQEGYFYLNIDENNFHSHLGPLGKMEDINIRLSNTFERNAAVQEDYVKFYEDVVDGKRVYYTIRKEGYNYTIAYAYESTLNSITQQITSDVVTLVFVIFIFLIVLSMIFIKNMTRSLNQLADYIRILADDHHAENPIKKYNQDEIGTLIEYINHLQSELIASEKQQKEMYQNISHDLKTPILVIKGYSMALIDGTFKGDEQDRVLKIVLDETERLTKKVNDLLYLTKLDVLSSKEEDKVETFNMRDLVIRIVENLEITKRDIHFEVDLIDSEFKGDIEKWHVAIENVLENFLRYAESVISVVLNEGEIILFNDGEAIDEAIVGDILEPYVKGNKGKFGLGLAITNKTIQNYGYELEVKNVEGGVQFRISLRK
jgi:two-component system sensor histidine kinase CssS